jgi:hypothetical protein
MNPKPLMQILYLLDAVTATGAGSTQNNAAVRKTYQASGTTSAAAGAATIKVQGSNNGINWDDIGTITLTLATTTSSDSFASDDRYAYIRGNVTAISGTDATVSLTVGR